MTDGDVGYLLISDDVLQMFELVVSVCVFGTVSFVAVVNNVVNMVLFVKQTLKDSMTVGLFALSFTDLAVSVIELAMSSTYLVNDLVIYSEVDLWALAYVCFGWALNAGYLISFWITAMISVERCMCVVSPFRVRLIFTRGRCAAVVVIIYVLHVVNLLPVYLVEKMQWVSVKSLNMSDNYTKPDTLYYTISFSDLSDETETAVDITAGLFLFLASQAVLLVSSLWMTYSLKVSSTVRNNPLPNHYKPFNFDKTKGNQLSIHEKKLIKLVLSLAVLQASCNMPRLAVTVFYNAYPGVNAGDLKNFSTMVWTVASLFNHICCATNTWCYYSLNSSYRKMFRQMFGLR